MSVLALSPPGAHLTADRPQDQTAFAQVARVPADRVSLTPLHRTGADLARAAFLHHTQHVNPANAVDLIPVASRSTSPSLGKDTKGTELARPPKSSDSQVTPPTVAERAIAAADASSSGARPVPDGPVGESARSAGLDSPPDTPAPEPTRPDGKTPAGATTPHRAGTGSLTADQALIVAQLQARDRQVRSHEAAHQAAGGTVAGAASFSYERGPDGKSYAVGGEVPIDISVSSNPSETIAKARQVRAAALAPADPSGQDLRVAAAAAALELEATLELSLQQRAARTTATRSNHVHGSAPCATCAKASTAYKAT